MNDKKMVIMDGNEAAASVAYRLSEVVAIYPITPSSPMAEWADQWRSEGKTNIWGALPVVEELQSEGGAAGALHGALQAGAFATTFTASQGLLLMIPNMFKIAGELTPATMHVTARTIATHALSIFGDHSDVMACRSTGWAMLASNSVQEAADLALIAQVATLETRIPFIHFFDGFRTSHEVGKILPIDDETIRAMVDDKYIIQFRQNALSPDRPVLRGSAQNPDVFFQAREACSPFHQAVPGIVQSVMDRFAVETGRGYRLFDYCGAPDAERVMVMMGSGAEAAEEAVDALNRSGEKLGLVKVRLYRPFDGAALINALPKTVKAIAVLDRCKEPGATGEPLYIDVVTVLAEKAEKLPFAKPVLIGGRYGLSSKEFTPAMVKGIFDELKKDAPKNHFTIGIEDDVSNTQPDLRSGILHRGSAYGAGSVLRAGLRRNGGRKQELDQDHRHGNRQLRPGIFCLRLEEIGVDDHLAPALRAHADPLDLPDHERKLCGVPQFQLPGKDGRTGSGHAGVGVPAQLAVCGGGGLGSSAEDDPGSDSAQEDRLLRDRRLHGGSGHGHGYPHQHHHADVLLCHQRRAAARGSDRADQEGDQEDLWQARRIRSAKRTLPRWIMRWRTWKKWTVPQAVSSDFDITGSLSSKAPRFVRDVLGQIASGKGDLLPVSALPAGGAFPTGTAQWEKRNIAQFIPVWDKELCIQCGKCVMVCPHAVIRAKVYSADVAADAPANFAWAKPKWRGMEQERYTLQVAPEDCTGCGVCVEICPVKSKSDASHKAINMAPQAPLREQERENWEFFLGLPEVDRAKLSHSQVKDLQLLQPLFEFSGACAGCGETAYIKLLTQLFGDRLYIANATGCSSIYGGNLPTTPYSQNVQGRGPTWANSLFEDNAEFGFGMRVALDQQKAFAETLLKRVAPLAGDELVTALLTGGQNTEPEINAQRERVKILREKLEESDTSDAANLLAIADTLVRKSVWILGGDGWAFDIGFGGLDHVLGSGKNVNVLVLDTEVYSNTGGQASKATPRGAVAKFAASGKGNSRKDLAMEAVSYGSVYVAQVALGANDTHTIKAFQEAEAHPGPSLIIAYASCIAHGYDLVHGLEQQKLAVQAGYWPLMRYNPGLRETGKNPFQLDSKAPSIRLKDYAYREARYTMLARSNPQLAEELLKDAQDDVERQWRVYSARAAMAGRGETPHIAPPEKAAEPEPVSAGGAHD